MAMAGSNIFSPIRTNKAAVWIENGLPQWQLFSFEVEMQIVKQKIKTNFEIISDLSLCSLYFLNLFSQSYMEVQSLYLFLIAFYSASHFA